MNSQPPSGGCVLKLAPFQTPFPSPAQPPSGGCVLKQGLVGKAGGLAFQPPSGGCVLKPLADGGADDVGNPAAFGRLCVETNTTRRHLSDFESQPPSGGCVLKRLCVDRGRLYNDQPPSGGCVLKQESDLQSPNVVKASRLRAAVC